jgi:hypothetical protein
MSVRTALSASAREGRLDAGDPGSPPGFTGRLDFAGFAIVLLAMVLL